VVWHFRSQKHPSGTSAITLSSDWVYFSQCPGDMAA
jgi:hypothetical protein